MSTSSISLDVNFTVEVPECVDVEDFYSEEEFEEEMVKELMLDRDDVLSYSIDASIQYPEWYDG